MDFYKKTQFLWSVVILITFMDVCNGLEGIPTWLCLGINSPFIKFKAEIEILGNNSVSLNLTKDDYTLMHHQGIEKLADFIKPVDLRNSSTGYLKSNLMKKIPSTQSSSSGRRKNYVENPISEEMDKKEIEILDDPNSESNMDFIRMEKKMNLSSFLSLSSSSSGSSSGSSSASSSSSFPSSSSLSSQLSSDRKYIVPMALRNPIKESTKTQQHNEQFSTNIDDLKNHILMLQNLTKNDKNFQSKFVVFPSLQREKNKTQSKFQSTTYPTLIYSPSLFSHTSSSSSSQQRRNSYGAAGGVSVGGVAAGGGGGAGIISISSRIKENSMLKTNIRNEDHIVEDNYQKENITIIPQVLLLNDQTPPDNADDERKRNRNNNNRDQKESVRSPHYRRRNFRKYPLSKTTSTTTTTTTMATTTTKATTTSMATTTKQTRKNPKRQKLQSGDIIGGGNRRKSNRRQHNCKNLDTPRCRRQRRKQLLNSGINNNNNNNGNKTSLNISDSNNDHEKFENRKNDSLWMMNRKQEDDEKLSRSARSNYAEKNINRNIRSSLHDIVTKDFIISAGNVASSSSSSQTTTYSEDINLNPNLCYQVGGMTYGQQNLCYHNPSIMPAVSRGARAAIQECQHQFHNRRWNCTTTDDNTVFGPMTSIGSPEMAFIHALAAATVTSFIARACRDGQLPQCGCSRSSRPKQLHDDWTWGGCGDDLEFAYKISQDFIDIREKERKREARELISVPQNGKRIEDKQQKSDNGNGNGGEIKNSKTLINSSLNNNTNGLSSSLSNMTVTASGTAIAASSSSQNNNSISNDNTNTNTNNNKNDDTPSSHINPEILLELQEKITKEILNSKLQEKEMIELQEKINREILNSKAFNVEYHTVIHGNNNNNNRKQRQHSKMDFGLSSSSSSSSSSSVSYLNRMNGISAKARSLMNLHNNEAGRRAVIKKTRITCKCHGISGSCSLITCWQQLSSIREIGDYLKEKYDEATEVKLNKRGRLQIKDSQYKIPTAHDLVYLDESPDWCRNSRQLQWPGTHGRVCNKTSSGLDGCAILCCGRGYNTKNRIVRERCNCKFHWCCQVKCEICVKVIEEYTCK